MKNLYPPPGFFFVEILPCFLAVIQAFIKQGNKLRLFSLFFLLVFLSFLPFSLLFYLKTFSSFLPFFHRFTFSPILP